MSKIISGEPTEFDIAQAYRRGLADGQANVEREWALARLATAYHILSLDGFPIMSSEDNRKYLAELERAAKQGGE